MFIKHLAIRVRDFEKSLAFYETLTGFSIVKKVEGTPGQVAYLGNSQGETQLELICLPDDQKFEGKGLFLCFLTKDILLDHKRAQEQGMNPSQVFSPDEKTRYFYAYDPDGLSVQIREEL